MKITHLLLLRPKPETTPEQWQSVIAALFTLKEKIPGILDVQTWKSFNVNLKGGYTDIAIFTFESEAHLAAYLQHPEHLAAIRDLSHLLDDSVVFDYAEEHS